MADQPSNHHSKSSPRRRAADLLSKHGVVVTELAQMLLNCAPGERIERVQTYAERFDAGVGTVHAALGYLQTSGAATLEARGRLGAYISALNYPLLWSLALHRPIIGALPLPYSLRFMGLATGVRAQFARFPLDLDLRFMRGASQRMQALASHACDWALVSRFAAETAGAHGFAVITALALGPATYMAGHVLLLRAEDAAGLLAGMRVGVDFQSADHVVAVRAATRGQQVELVPIEYSEGLELVSAGVIDATVWSPEDIPDALGLTQIPLDPDALPELEPLSEATLVINRDNRAIASLLTSVLAPEELMRIQHSVVHRTQPPLY
jgi:hypothetical protein